jgi:hypothetical protein
MAAAIVIGPIIFLAIYAVACALTGRALIALIVIMVIADVEGWTQC